MQTENAARADLWDIAIALYRTSQASAEEANGFERHLSSFITHELVGDQFTIGVENEFAAEFYNSRFAEPLRLALVKAGAPENVKVTFSVTTEAVKVSEEKQRQTAEQQTQGQEAAKAPRTTFNSTMPFNQEYTFENFVRGPSNSFAYAIASAVAKEPGGHTNNPFIIWGGSGLGKTHLMQAIGHHVMRRDPSKSVCYITSETFLNEYINALSNKAMETFRQRYRHIDLLLLDDVQFVGGKEQFQEEFFNTYDGLMTYGKQIVMTCDVPPKKLSGFEERLITRFQQGIAIDIKSPSYETRVAILKSKARNIKLDIPETVFQYIGENIKSSVRAMEGALNLVIQYMTANPGMDISPHMDSLLKELTEEEVNIRRLSIEDIIKAVCATYDVTYADMLSRNKTQPLATARQAAMFLACKLTQNSYPAIGAALDRNHTTAMHGTRTIQKRLDVEPELKKTLEKITENLGRKPSELFD